MHVECGSPSMFWKEEMLGTKKFWARMKLAPYA